MCKLFRENVLKNVQVDIFHSKMSRTTIIHQTVAVAIISTFSIVCYMAGKSTRQVLPVNKNPLKRSFKRCLLLSAIVLRLIRKAHMIESFLYNNSIRKEHFTNIPLKRLDRKLKTKRLIRKNKMKIPLGCIHRYRNFTPKNNDII